MKRIFTVFWVIVLLFSTTFAHAENVLEQVNAPKTLVEQFVSKTKKTVIDIDAKISVPLSNSVYLIPLSCTSFSQEEVNKLTKHIQPNGAWEMSQSSDYVGHVYHQFKLEDPQNNLYHMVSEGHFLSPQGETYGAFLSYQLEHDMHRTCTGDVNYIAQESQAIEGEKIKEHILTTQQAVETANAFLTQITDLPFEVSSIGAIPGFVYLDVLESIQKGISYQITYTQNIDGVPLTNTHEAMLAEENIFTVPVGYEKIRIIIDNKGQVCYFDWQNPYQIKEKGQRVEKLLPFHQIIQSAKEIMPLTLAYAEKDGTSKICIDRIAFEYMPVLQRNQTNQFTLMPVWNFYGMGDIPYFHCTIQDYCWLTVSAIDGTVIDRNYGY